MFNHKALYPMKSAIMFILFLLPIIYFKWKCEKIKPVRPSYHVYYLIYFNLWQGKIKWEQPVKSSFRTKDVDCFVSKKKKNKKKLSLFIEINGSLRRRIDFSQTHLILIYDSNIMLDIDRGTAG